MSQPQPSLTLPHAEADSMLADWLGAGITCHDIRALEGGMMNSVFRLEFDRAPFRAVIKLHSPRGQTFDQEAVALEYLRTKTSCPVPEVYLADTSGRKHSRAFLLLQHLPGVCLKAAGLEQQARDQVEGQLGDVLGELHRHQRDWWGQVHEADKRDSWGSRVQARLLRARSHPAVEERLERAVLERVDTAIERAPVALDDSGPPSLIHGDVWDGNIMVDRHESGWRLTGLLDPNLQFADREQELAYLEVFDVKRNLCFQAYERLQATRPGYPSRRRFYWLETALVHVALFGDAFFCAYTARIAAEISETSS